MQTKLPAPFDIFPSTLRREAEFYDSDSSRGGKITLPLAGTWHIVKPWTVNGPYTFDSVVVALLQKYPPNMQRFRVSWCTYFWSSESIEILVRNMRQEILPGTEEDPEELVPEKDRVLLHCYAQSEVDLSDLLPEAQMVACVLCSQKGGKRSCIHKAASSTHQPTSRKITNFQPY